jgi:hypothetical protein
MSDAAKFCWTCHGMRPDGNTPSPKCATPAQCGGKCELETNDLDGAVACPPSHIVYSCDKPKVLFRCFAGGCSSTVSGPDCGITQATRGLASESGWRFWDYGKFAACPEHGKDVSRLLLAEYERQKRDAEALGAEAEALRAKRKAQRIAAGYMPPSPERNAAIVNCHSTGEKNMSIAKRFGISRSRVHQILRKHK